MDTPPEIACATAPITGALVPLPPIAGDILPAVSPAEQLLAAWLAARTPQTLRAYRADVRDFAAFLGVPTPEAAAWQLLEHGPAAGNLLALRYKEHLVNRGLAPNSINRKLAALRSLCSAARAMGLVAWELQVAGMKAVAYKDTRGPGLPKLRRVFEQLTQRTDAKGRRDLCIIRLAYDLGLRRKEIVGLDLADADLEEGTLQILGKGRAEKERLSLPPKTAEAIRQWLAHRGDAAGPLFVNLSRAWKRNRLTVSGLYFVVRLLGERTNVRLRPHMVRHQAITDVLTACRGDVREARKFSRHADVKTLMIYDDQRTDGGGRLARKISDNL